jgi:hypothetical protein
MADAGAAVAIAAAIANAIKASGAIVNVEPEAFAGILRKSDKPLIVYTQGGLFLDQSSIPDKLQRLYFLYEVACADRSSERR